MGSQCRGNQHRLRDDQHSSGASRFLDGAQLKGIWSDLLQIEAIGLDDDFFELGGNSLLAVNLFARIESQLGLKLPLSTIIEAPTIGQLTRSWRPGRLSLRS